MKKNLFMFAIVAMLGTVSASAQSINYKKGYRANVELSLGIQEQFAISSSHGYSFGNGLYVGGGVAFMAETLDEFTTQPNYLTPIFADMKYSFLNRKVSPFAAARIGGIIDINRMNGRLWLNPSIGLDINRFSIGVGYDYQHAFGSDNDGFNLHNVRLSVGFTF